MQIALRILLLAVLLLGPKRSPDYTRDDWDGAVPANAAETARSMKVSRTAQTPLTFFDHLFLWWLP